MIQETLRDKQWDPMEWTSLRIQKRYMTNSGIQSNWLPWWSKTLHDQHGDPTDLLGDPKTLRDQQGDPTDLLDV